MDRRNRLLFLASVPIVFGSVGLSKWAHSGPEVRAGRNAVASSIRADDLYSFLSHESQLTDEEWNALSGATEEVAERWQHRLGPQFNTIVKTPFAICGDVPEDALDHCFAATIAPAAAGMSREFFKSVPDCPVTLLLLKDEASYRRVAKQHFDQEHVSIYGYYKPSTRTIVINLAAGSGTIIHELTHALLDFDFPNVPIWFNEGLASFHEQCNLVMTDVGPVIEPLPNWRLPILKEAIVNGELPSIRELLLTENIRGSDEAVKYAHARYFCMFLNQRGVLSDFYAAFRDAPQDATAQPFDRSGTAVLASFFPDTDLNTLDSQFRRWAMTVRLK